MLSSRIATLLLFFRLPVTTAGVSPAADGELALMCDFILASERAKFGVPEIQLVSDLGARQLRADVRVVLEERHEVAFARERAHRVFQVPRTPEELKKMQDLVAAALGIPPSHGVALALIRKLRILVWNAAGLVVLARARR